MLGFLTNLRDVKSSLTSGMILLFTMWLIFGNALNKVPSDDSLTGNLTRIAGYLSTPGTLAVLVFIAYVIGMVTSTHSWLNAVEAYKGGKIVKTVSNPTGERFTNFLDDLIDDVLRIAKPLEVIAILKLDGPDFARIRHHKHDDSQKADFKRQLKIHLNSYVLNDLKVLANQLHASHEKSWEKYDKAYSEAEFRAGMLLPLMLMMVALSYRIASEWNYGLMYAEIGVLLAVQLSLVIKATSKRQEANDEIIHAIVNGKIDVPPITTLKKLVSH